MKALPFKIPYTTDASFLVQEDLMPRLYGSLHTHPEIQITLILESSGTLFIGDYIGDFNPGDIIIIGSNIPHVFQNDPNYNETGDAPMAHAISIFMGPEILSNKLFNIPEMESFRKFVNNTQKGLMADSSQFQGIDNDFFAIRDKEGLPKLIALFGIINKLSSGNFKLLSHHPQMSLVAESDGKRLKDIFEFTFREYTRVITLEEIADIANMTPQSFCRFFKQRTRKTYVNFLNELRINKAAQLLKKGEHTVSEISFLTGFNNLSHFNRQFKLLKGQTPSEFRSQDKIKLQTIQLNP